MKPITVFVTAVGNCGIGEGIVKALNLAKGKYKIVGGDMNPLSAFSYRIDAGYVVPPATGPKYFEIINKICRQEKVDILIPGSDKEIWVIANALDKIDKNVFVLVHPKETVDICKDKWETYKFLKNNEFDSPESYIPEEPKKLPFPLFIKERIGGGSKNAFKIDNETELEMYLKYYKEKKLRPILQSYIGVPEEEYTTGVLLGKDKRVISAITFKRNLVSGSSMTMICEEYPQVTNYAINIAKTLKTMGSINIQSRLVNGKPYAFEINPRFSGSTPARAGLGANEVDLAIVEFYLGKKVESPKIQYGQVVMRCFHEIYANLEEVKKIEKGLSVSRSGKVYNYV